MTERVSDLLEQAGVDMRAAYHVAMILEELLTNLGTHAGLADESVTVKVSVEPSRVVVECLDSGAPFDPRSTPDPDVEAPLEERSVGGLGLFLVRRFASDLDYSRRDGRNRTVFTVARG